MRPFRSPLTLAFTCVHHHQPATWRAGFCLDLIASLPIDWFLASGLTFEPPDTGSTTEATSQIFSMLRLFKLLKLLRVLRVAKLVRTLSNVEDFVAAMLSLHTHSIFALLKLLIMLLTFAHWNGCIQVYASYSIDTVAINTHLNGTTTLVLHPESWLVRAKLHGQGWGPMEQWSWAYYHAMVQLLAISDGIVEPRRLHEVWFFMLSILFGASLYAIFVASLTTVIGELGAASRKYRARIDMLGEYMRHSKMPNDLRQRLLAYYELAYPGRIVCDERTITEEISHPRARKPRALTHRPSKFQAAACAERRTSSSLSSWQCASALRCTTAMGCLRACRCCTMTSFHARWRAA